MGKYSSLEGVGPLPEDIRRGRVGPFAAEAKAPFPVERLNSSGVALLNGDVVVVHTDGTILRTTTAQDTRPVGVLLDDCADGIYGPVLFEGPCPLVNVTGSVTAGHYVETTTTGGQATGNSTRREGSFGRFTSGGTTPTAFLYGPQPDLSEAGGAGDAADIAYDNSGSGLAATDVQDAIDELAGLGGGATGLLAVVHNTTGGNKTSTSTTQADIDAANSAITFTAPASGNVLVRLTCTVNLDGSSNQNSFLGIRESTTDVVNKIFADQCPNGVATEHVVSVAARVSGISAGAHTYKAAFAVNGGVAMTVRQSTANPVVMEVWAAP